MHCVAFKPLESAPLFEEYITSRTGESQEIWELWVFFFKSTELIIIHTFFFFLILFFQLLNLLEVIIDNAESKQSSSVKSGALVSEHPSGPQLLTPDTEMNAESGGTSTVVGTSTKAVESSSPSTSSSDSECDAQTVLLNLPQAELRLLCSLLAREGYE